MSTVSEVLALDPSQTTLPNDGVAQVAEPVTAHDYDVLRWELKSFVCRGEFERGLERILESYLANLGQPRQPAVWISGFYGSGKSHLARVLQFLWRNHKLPDGAAASSLINVPPSIQAHLQELATAGRRHGGLWSAAGKLQSANSGSVRLRLLEMVLKSAGLPSQVVAGRFALWMHEEQVYEQVFQHVVGHGRDFEYELTNLYVSPPVARALLEAMPTFAENEAAVRRLLKDQFPVIQDLSNDELVLLLERILRQRSTATGKLPCTLVILDELQQFVGDRAELLAEVQEVVETCSASFRGQLLFVATGQSALPAHQLLSKLKDRFTVRVELRESDRNYVVREVVLRKKPSHTADVSALLEQNSGEIDRHLVGSRLGATEADNADLVADYPLLPTRRRFWDAVLRGVDGGGSGAQLRTQLRVVFEGARSVGDQPLGHVIPADFLYEQQSGQMRQAGALLGEIDTKIRELDDGSTAGRLRSRLCALVFLIGKVHHDEGLKATPSVLADLLVEDLRAGSAPLRQAIPQHLASLVDEGQLLQVGEEYRIQTRQGAEWESEYRERYGQVQGDDVRLDSERQQRIHGKLVEALRGLVVTQGVSKTARGFELFTGDTPPSTDGPKVPVWVRDGWVGTEKAAREDALNAGVDSSLVTLFLPRLNADKLRLSLAAALAATDTIGSRQSTATDEEGETARSAMATRQRTAIGDADALLETLLSRAVVLQGGGADVTGVTLKAAVEAAVRAGLDRLYTRFAPADDAKWGQVMTRARDGNTDALSALGFRQEAAQHPVCAEILSYLGQHSRRGSEIRKHFDAPPFGWPTDATHAALAALVAAGQVKATEHGAAVNVKEFSAAQIGNATFQREGDVVSTLQRIHVRKLLQTAGVAYKENQEAAALPEVVAQLKALAALAGGDAPAPSPPDTGHLHGLSQLSGNALIVACAEQREQLLSELAAWQTQAGTLTARRERWRRLNDLLLEARGLPVHPQVAPQAEAILAQRSLLADPDPVPGLCAELADALRGSLQAVWQAHATKVGDERTALAATTEWQHLPQPEREALERQFDLAPGQPLAVGDEAALLQALDHTSLDQWATRLAAVPQQAKSARLAAAQRLEPQAQPFSAPPASLKTAADVEAYVEAMRAALLARVAQGPVVIQ